MSPSDKDIMLRRPRDPNERLIDKEMLAAIITSGIVYGILESYMVYVHFSVIFGQWDSHYLKIL